MINIYGTLGPQCSDTDTLTAMFQAGMTGVRLNLSHCMLADAAQQIRCLQDAAARCGQKAQLIIDLQGPELRIGSLSAPVMLTEGARVSLGEDGIPVPESVFPYLLHNQEVLLDDGKLMLCIIESHAHFARAEVVRGGLLHGKKSLALPGSAFHLPTLTQNDLVNIRSAAQYGVTGVMQPFVRDAGDLKTVRTALEYAGVQEARLFAKIENMTGYAHLDELIPAADEIVIARGDLGNAVALWELPAIQKRIAARCVTAQKPFMVVTQMLSSMEHNPVPTRAEVSDIFNAVLDGAASVMVTGETAIGRYPVETVGYLANTVRAACSYCGACR